LSECSASKQSPALWSFSEQNAQILRPTPWTSAASWIGPNLTTAEATPGLAFTVDKYVLTHCDPGTEADSDIASDNIKNILYLI
jgi:hypothetical protein